MKSRTAIKFLVPIAFALAAAATSAATLFPVIVSGRWGYVDKSGKQVIPPQFERADSFVGDLAPVRLDRWGYVNPGGKIAINPQFDEATPFHAGLAAVELQHRWGYIDKSGKLVINPQFESAGDFSENLAFAEVKD